MNPKLRIAVADDEPDMQQYFERILPRMGYEVVVVAENGQQLVEKCRQSHPDLVITDIKMPIMDGIEAAHRLCQERPVPVILVSAYHNGELIARAEADHVQGYLVKPIKQADLEPAISLAVRRFEQLHSAQQEAAELRQTLEDERLLERARGILRKRAAVDNDEAQRRLEQLAQQQGLRPIDVARCISLSDSAFAGFEPPPTGP